MTSSSDTAGNPTQTQADRSDETIRADITKIYIGYFGRAPDPGGHDYWFSEAEKGYTALETAASFSVQKEAKDKYPYLKNPDVEDPGEFVTQVYLNLFNREPDAGGKAYWVGKLEAANGEPEAVGRMILDIISGAKNTEDGQDLTTVNNKMVVALDWVESVREIPDFEYVGNTEAAASAVSVIEDVDETPQSVSEGLAETDAYVASNQPGGRFSLTENVDGVQDYTGTASDDAYVATAETLNTGDHLDGAGGRDKLTIQAGQADSIVATPILENIEEVEIRGGADALEAELDFSASTGVEKGTLNGVTGSVEFVGAQYPFDLMVSNADASFEEVVERVGEFSSTLTVDYAAQSVSADDDVQRLELSNAGLRSLSVEGIEAIEATVSGENYVANLNAIADLKIDGTGNFVASLGSKETVSDHTIDSTESTGDVGFFLSRAEDVVVRAGLGDDYFSFLNFSSADVSGGDGNDVFRFLRVGEDGLNGDSTVDGGEGEDMIYLSLSSAADADVINQLSSLEVLGFYSRTSSIEVSQFDEIHEFLFEGGVSSRGRLVEIAGIESEDLMVFSNDQVRSDSTLSFSGEAVGETLNLELRALEDGVYTPTYRMPENGNVEILATGPEESDADEDDFISAIVLDDNFSSVTITSTGINEAANEISAVQGETAGTDYYAFANTEGPSTFTIVGDHALTISAAEGDALTAQTSQWGFADAANVDASGLLADLRIAMSADGDVLIAGAGDDILYGLQGDDRLTGNDGADQFRFVGTESTDDILDFIVEDDMIGFNTIDFANTSASYEGTTLSEEDYVENRDNIGELNSGDDKKVVELQEGLSASQIAEDNGAEIEAYVLVLNTTTEQAELWYDDDWSSSEGRSQIASLDSIVDLAGVQDFTSGNFVEFIA